MAYQPNTNQAKKAFPFSASDFSLGLNSTPKKNGRKSNLILEGGPKKINFKARFLAEEAGRDSTFLVTLSFKDLPIVARAIKTVAETAGEEKTSVSFAVRYFAKGEFQYSGTTITIGRNDSGIVYLTFTNKSIENVYFKLLSESELQMLGPNKEPADPRLNSRDTALGYYDWLMEIYRLELRKALAKGEDEKLAQGDNGGNYQQAGAATPPPVTAPVDDFDETLDIPF